MSCTDNLAIFHSSIALGFEKRESCAALFIDIQGAYDNVLCDILIKSLKELGIPEKTLTFIFNLVHCRRTFIRFDSLDIARNAYKGLSQGSVLSPTLYSLYTREIETKIADLHELKILQFADDICLYSINFDADRAVRTIEEGGNKVGLAIWVSHWLLINLLCAFSVNFTRSEIFNIQLNSNRLSLPPKTQ